MSILTKKSVKAMNKSCRSLICNPSKIVYIPDKLRIFFRPKLHFGMFLKKSQSRKPNVNSILFSRLHVRKSTSFSTLLIDLHIFKKEFNDTRFRSYWSVVFLLTVRNSRRSSSYITCHLMVH